jgi:hypothetical protein
MVRATATQGIQIGPETTPGTAVAAGKVIDAWTVKSGPKADTKQSTPTGRNYVAAQALNMEHLEFTVESPIMDYNSLVYKLASVYGIITPVAHGSSTIAKDWSITPPVAGAGNPKTYTIEQGDASYAHKFAYGLMNKFGYKWSKKDASSSASGFARKVQDNITMTASPVQVPVVPMVGSQFKLYLDATSSALGTTTVTNLMDGEYGFDGPFNPVWFANRDDSSISTHVAATPKTTGKIRLEANSNGMGLLANLRNQSTVFLRVEAIGDLIDNQQTVSLGSPSAGNWTLTYKGQTTANIAYNAAASAVQTALQALSTVGASNATVAGSAGGPYTVTFAAALATDTTALTGSGAGLTGGTFLITQSQVYHKFVHDMAAKITAPNDWDDGDGVFCIPWDFTVVEDATWGAQTFTVTNKLTAL